LSSSLRKTKMQRAQESPHGRCQPGIRRYPRSPAISYSSAFSGLIPTALLLCSLTSSPHVSMAQENADGDQTSAVGEPPAAINNARSLLEPWLSLILLYHEANCCSSHVFSSFSITHVFSQESSAPSGISGWRFHTGQCDQLRFLPPRHVPLLWSFWLFSSTQRVIPSMRQKTASDSPDGCRTPPTCFLYSLIRPLRAMCSTIRCQ